MQLPPILILGPAILYIFSVESTKKYSPPFFKPHKKKNIYSMIRDFQKIFYKAFQLFGIDLQCSFNTFRVMPYFIRSLLAYQKSARGTGFQLKLKHFHPILNDIYKPAGATQNHYFFSSYFKSISLNVLGKASKFR